MTPVVAFITTFIIGASADWLSCRWHDARDKRQRFRVAKLAMLIELFTWIPIDSAININVRVVALAAILGSGIGSYLGVRPMRDGENASEDFELCQKCGGGEFFVECDECEQFLCEDCYFEHEEQCQEASESDDC